MASIDTFVEDTLAIMAGRSLPLPEAPGPTPGSLWLSRSTHRRASVVWASQGCVCLSYDETSQTARKVHRLVDFLLLYVEAN